MGKDLSVKEDRRKMHTDNNDGLPKLLHMKKMSGQPKRRSTTSIYAHLKTGPLTTNIFKDKCLFEASGH